jgi:phosphotransferase system enzyme I (PtsP)
VRAAQAQGKPVSVCGEMAHEPEYLPFFIGIGVRTISADPRYLPDLQQQICRMELSQAEALARELLAQSTIQKSWEVLERFGKRENR